MSDGTPERLFPERWRFAQSSGEWPGDRSTLPRGFGVLTTGARPPPNVGGPRFGTGPRFGSGPVVGTRIDCVDVGSARRFEGFIRGGGISEGGFGGGAMPTGFEGGAMPPSVGGAGAEALWAEFMAGKEGGGRWSSSSSSELSCSASVKVGIAGPFAAAFGTALGVV
jgi:hypothetical protein